MKLSWGGEVLRVGAADLRVAGLPAARPVGEVLAGRLTGAAREVALGGAGLRVAGAARLQEVEVVDALEAVGRIGGDLVRARLRLACEVAGRGLHAESGFTLVDWLAQRCPDLSRRDRVDLSKLAVASTEEVHAPVIDGVLDGRMSLERAAFVLRALQRIRPGLDSGLYAAAVAALCGLAGQPGVGERDVDKAVSELLRRCLPEKEHDKDNKARRALGDVHESNLADGSVKRIIMTFGDDGDYEAVRAVLFSPLAAPASAEEAAATGQEDTRTPGRRRYDALMTVIRRGVAGSKGQPTTPKAMVMVSIDFEVLRRLLSESGDAPGCGATLDGRTITAETIRRLACEADIIPVVLGTEGEILDQGRKTRLVTPGQRVNLARRDQGCTFPGCSVPATWCDAHHVIWWSREGDSDVLNYALLCPRHHTWVHDHDATATVTALGVTWHLR